MHTLTSHQLTTPLVERRHFGLGTVASPCGNPAYRNSPAGRAFCEREAELERQAEAWTEYYRSQGIDPNDRDAIEEFHGGVPLRYRRIPSAAPEPADLRAPGRVIFRRGAAGLVAEFFTLQNTRRLIKDRAGASGVGGLDLLLPMAEWLVVGGSFYLIRRLAKKG